MARDKNDSQSNDPAPGSSSGSSGGGKTGGGKGRPTPTRRSAQSANKKPLVPTDRKAAGRANKAKQREARARMHQAMISGDERHLPARDKGPIRRFVRDWIDARWNVGEFFLPVSFAIVLAVLIGGSNAPQLTLLAIMTLYLIIIVAVVDAWLATRRIKKRILARYGEVPKGTLMYGAMRAFQLRRTRMPRPQVKRGEYPA